MLDPVFQEHIEPTRVSHGLGAARRSEYNEPDELDEAVVRTAPEVRMTVVMPTNSLKTRFVHMS